MKKIRLWQNRDEISDYETIIDDEDYEKIVEAIKYKNGKPGKWYAHKTCAGSGYYAFAGDHRKSMHRVIMDPPKGMDIDHINGNTLDNRKENLRICTRSQNSQNRKLRSDSASGYKGVYKHKARNLKKPFEAYIGDSETSYPSTKHINLGCYTTAEEAARARDKKAKELHGEFAYLNFPEEHNDILP